MVATTVSELLDDKNFTWVNKKPKPAQSLLRQRLSVIIHTVKQVLTCGGCHCCVSARRYTPQQPSVAHRNQNEARIM